MSKLRPECGNGAGHYCPTGGTAYLMIANAVKAKSGLIWGALHDGRGGSCAIGSFFDQHPRAALDSHLIDEVASVNDSFRTCTPEARKAGVLRWLRWKMAQLGMSVGRGRVARIPSAGVK